MFLKCQLLRMYAMLRHVSSNVIELIVILFKDTVIYLCTSRSSRKYCSVLKPESVTQALR